MPTEGVKIRLDSKAIRTLLQKDPAINGMVDSAAKVLAANIGESAEVDDYQTDRAAAAVSVPAEDQARDGALTRAAAAVGLKVKVK